MNSSSKLARSAIQVFIVKISVVFGQNGSCFQLAYLKKLGLNSLNMVKNGIFCTFFNQNRPSSEFWQLCSVFRSKRVLFLFQTSISQKIRIVFTPVLEFGLVLNLLLTLQLSYWSADRVRFDPILINAYFYL